MSPQLTQIVAQQRSADLRRVAARRPSLGAYPRADFVAARAKHTGHSASLLIGLLRTVRN